MAEPTANDARPIAEISHGPSAFENFLENNQKLLIALGILIAVGTGGWIVYQGMEEGKRLEAASALSAAGGQTERFLRFEMPTEIDPPEPPPVEEDPGSDATDPDMTGAAPTGNPLLDSLNADPVDADETTPVEPAPEPEPAPGDAPDAGAAEESPSTEGSTEAPPAERPAPESGE